MRVGEVYIFSVTLRLARVNKAWDKNVLLSVVWWQYTLRAAFIGFYFVRLEKFRGLGVVSCGESLENLVDIYCTFYIINIQLSFQFIFYRDCNSYIFYDILDWQSEVKSLFWLELSVRNFICLSDYYEHSSLPTVVKFKSTYLVQRRNDWCKDLFLFFSRLKMEVFLCFLRSKVKRLDQLSCNLDFWNIFIKSYNCFDFRLII